MRGPSPCAETSKPCRRCSATPASCSPPTPTPACCPPSPTTPPRPPRLILTAASTTSRTIRNGHHSSHHKPDDTTATRHHPATAINTAIPPLTIRPPDPSQQKHENGSGADQPGSTSRDVSVGNWVSWPHIGPTQDHLVRVKIHHGGQRRRPAPMLILWAAWGSNPESKD
jgi:hypothetical protein